MPRGISQHSHRSVVALKRDSRSMAMLRKLRTPPSKLTNTAKHDPWSLSWTLPTSAHVLGQTPGRDVLSRRLFPWEPSSSGLVGWLVGAIVTSSVRPAANPDPTTPRVQRLPPTSHMGAPPPNRPYGYF